MTKTTTKWFYHTNQIVKGPCSTEELQDLLPTFTDPKKTFIWSRGYTEWISADRWQPVNQKITPPAQKKSQIEEPTVTHFEQRQNQNIPTETLRTDEEVTKTSIPNIENQDHTFIPTTMDLEKFRVQLNFVDQPLMTKEELMVFASKVDDPSQIAIFDPKLQEWKEIYAFKEIIEKLGLTRRKHPRVPILAQFSGTSSQHEQFNARLVTVSIGGLGLTDVFDLKVGDSISGQITSPHFYSPVTIEAEATYCGNDGYVGLKFTQINDDSQSLVTDYVKRFSKNI